MSKPILLSGVKPTNRVHIGNYFGVMKQFVELQNDYSNYIFIADYHALNQVKKADELNDYIFNLAVDYLAIGLDPAKTVLFKQSDVPAVCELQWIFNCLLPMAYLERAHAYKDAVAKNSEVNMGLFNYPVLMAADILIYDADVVPVGQDQKQHLEMAVELANKFNNAYGEMFKLPKPIFFNEVVIPGTDGGKMSKSKGNMIELFEPDDSLKRKVMGIVTDSSGVNEPKDPDSDKVFAYHKLFSGSMIDSLRDRYLHGEIGHKESKEILYQNIIAYMAPYKAKRESLMKDRAYVLQVLADGAAKASIVAEAKMAKVKEAIGVILK